MSTSPDQNAYTVLTHTEWCKDGKMWREGREVPITADGRREFGSFTALRFRCTNREEGCLAEVLITDDYLRAVADYAVESYAVELSPPSRWRKVPS